jgi:HK97 family phage prohead protease
MPQAPSNGREQRQLTLDEVRVRTEVGGDRILVRGHAAVWDKTAWIGPPRQGFSERFAPGAFKESITKGADVRYLFNHNPDHVLARTKAGTLKLGEDSSGLTVEADLAPTQVGKDLAILMERGDVNQMSVGMQVLDEEWTEVRGGDGNFYEQRTIKAAKLFDVSAVTYPAYEDTDAGLRQAEHARELRDARGVAVDRKRPEPKPIVPPAPPRAPRIEILPDGSFRIHRPDGTTIDVTGQITGNSVAFDGSALRNQDPQNANGNTHVEVNIEPGSITDPATMPTPATVTTNADGLAVSTPGTPATPTQVTVTAKDSPSGDAVPPPPGPATATSDQTERRGYQLSESERSLFELIQEHWATPEHRKAPRLKCPACNRPATATGAA